MLQIRRLAVLVAALGLLALACGGAERDDSGAVVGAGDVSAFEMRIGDCFDDPSSAEEQVSSLTAVPCETPHDNQVFALLDYPGGSDDAYPGQQTLLDYSNDACLEPFEPFVGKAYEESHFAISVLFPSSDSWDQGDREIVCFLYDLTLEPWEGTAEGRAE